jgi:hypothetical protein
LGKGGLVELKIPIMGGIIGARVVIAHHSTLEKDSDKKL